MPSAGIKPENLRSLTRRSNQLSYAAIIVVHNCANTNRLQNGLCG